MTNDEQLRYPTGRFNAPASYTREDVLQYIEAIKTLPGRLRQAVIQLTDAQLNTPYRTGGWTLKQVVHHLADSHMNALMRIKLALTEENPTIKAYNEPDWALLPDYRLPVESSLKLLEGVHQHLTALFESFTENEWSRTFYHPDRKDTISLQKSLAMYAWHSNHHLAHITETMKQWR
ncbi:putative metal-dependent hydrolase [Mucilaginibacter robiniae]|uniref:Putative metal-dependent hydrolase n=1 Tax=Mucilaginibacter robiniae TaxID=2728022 RepID=A0A7L5E7R2_9SPHI|nr:putative metal-dependent hydrolase [Mucilaginibacter robiniae]QJD96396.1 putative metal-dependent hydrolase [Mucilaginibacter robiniae]